MSFSNVEIEGKKAAPDRIYYNATVINNTQTTIQQDDDPSVVFQDQRQTPLVPDASNYEVSVQNFTLNGAPKTLPLFIPQISPPITTTIQAGVTAVVSNSTVQSNTTSPPTYYKQIKYNFPNSFSVGNIVNQCSGFTEGFLNFTTPQKIIACDSVSFTIIEYKEGAIDGTYTPVGFVAFEYQDPTIIDTTIYTITFSCFDGSTYRSSTIPILWVPENKAPYTAVPTTALPTQKESDYYYCYTYTHWIQLVNTALRLAWTTAGGGVLFGTLCPWFEYDETTGLFSINQDSKTSMTPVGTALSAPYNVTYTAAGLYTAGEYSFVGMNTCLESLLTNFNSQYYAYGQFWNNDPTLPLLPEIIIDMGLPINLLNIPLGATTNSAVGVSLRTVPKTSIFQLANPFDYTPITTGVFVRLVQDYISTGGIWSPIASFVLGTSQVPVRNEASANPITFGAANIGGNTSTSGSFQKVLIEAPINALRADYWKGFIFYEPTTLTYSTLDPSHDGIQNVDISLYWRNRLTNALIPVRLPNQGSVSFRLLFKKKLML
jgi:hypothetical protein